MRSAPSTVGADSIAHVGVDSAQTVFFKEWRGAGAFTKKLVILMLALLVGSTCIIGWGNKKSEDAANAKAGEVATAAAETSGH